jgi:arginase family enzyme
MLDNKIRVLNFDGSVIAQKKLLSRFESEVVDFKDIGESARHWLTPKLRVLIQERLRESAQNRISLIGSGDYHHISEILISQFGEPLTVIIFDRHSDRSLVSPRFACGSWVRQLLKKKNIREVILLGEGKRPAQEEASLAGVLEKLPCKSVYLSIDKDCLKNTYALTNWEEGRLTLDELLAMLKLVREKTDIAGMDIVGDYSLPRVRGAIKKVVSYFDHPRRVRAQELPLSQVNSLNEATNLRILEVAQGAF